MNHHFKFFQMKIKFLTVLFVLVLICYLPGSSQTYNLSITNEPYVPLTGGTSLVQGVWDDPEFNVPLGFSFDYYGQTTDMLHVISGFLGGIYTTNLDANAVNLMAVFATDFVDRGYNTGQAMSPILFKTTGTTGHRITTVEFKNAGFFSDTVINGVYQDFINFQLRLFEETGNIEMHLGPYSVSNIAADFDGPPGPIVGLIEGLNYGSGEVSGEVLLLNGDPVNPEIITTYNDAYLTWPIPENTVYRFSTGATATHDLSKPQLEQYYFPNPCVQNVTLKPELRDEIQSPVYVFNSLGQIVRIDDQPERIELDGLSVGIYQLRFNTKDGQVIQRISLMN